MLLVCTTITGCASLILGFSAEPITATVVDEETKKPLEGVIVVAHWQLVEGGFLDSSVRAGELMVMETLTDANGKFHFPEWGPKYKLLGRMKNDDPQLIIFKPGYEFKSLANEWSSTEIRDYRALRSSDWDGKTIELKVFKGTMSEYNQHLLFLNSDMYFATRGSKNCEWKNTKQMIVAMQELKTEFIGNGIMSDIYFIKEIPVRECGNPAEVFEKYE